MRALQACTVECDVDDADRTAAVARAVDAARSRGRTARYALAVVVAVAVCAYAAAFSGGESYYDGARHTASPPAGVAGAVAPVMRRLEQGVPLRDIPANETCAVWVQHKYACSEPKCEESKVGFINYIYFHECTMRRFKGLSFTILAVGFLLLLYLLEDTTDHYFCVAIKRAVQAIGLSPEVAGVTFLSVGNGASDVFSSIAAFAGGAPKIGIGTLVGAALFVATVVVGAVALTVPNVQMRKGPFVRETMFLCIAVLYLFYCMHDSKVTILEIMGFFIVYAFFVAAVLAVKVYNDRQARQRGDSAAATPGARPSSTAGVSLHTGDAGNGPHGSRPRPIARGKDGSPPTLPAGAEAATSRSAPVDESTALLADAGTFSPGSLRNSPVVTPSLGTPRTGRVASGAAAAGAGGGAGAGGADSVVSGTSARAAGRQRSRSQLLSPSQQQALQAVTRVVPSGKDSTGGGSRPRCFSDSSARVLQEYYQPPPPVFFHKANRFTSSFLEILGANPCPQGPPRKAVASAFARSSAYNTDPAVWAGRQRPHTFQASQLNNLAHLLNQRRSGGARLGALRAPAAGPNATAEDYVNLYHSGGLNAAAAEGTGGKRPVQTSVATVASAMASQGATGCKVWWLKLQDLLYPLLRAFNWPIKMLRNISIPRVEDDCWDKRYAAVCPFFGLPLTGFTVMKPEMLATIGGTVPVWALVMVVAVVWTCYLAYVLPREKVPEGGLRLMLVCFAFLTSIIWILIIANELVGIAAFFGTVSGLSESMVGITILAIGNSVNDLAADVTIARAGFPSMAIAGAYAGPMFNILFGLGVPLLIEITKNGAVSLGQDSVTVNYSLLCAAGFVVFSLVTVAASGFRVTRPIGGALLFLYGVFFVFLVIIQVKH